MNWWQRRFTARHVKRLQSEIPGAQSVSVSWQPAPTNEGWRIAVRLDHRYVLRNEQRLISWVRWSDGWSLGAGRSLVRAFAQAHESAQQLRALLSCPECGAVLDPGATLSEAMDRAAAS